eukprot:353399-Chlamydomonas_euryale.AAC.1
MFSGACHPPFPLPLTHSTFPQTPVPFPPSLDPCTQLAVSRVTHERPADGQPSRTASNVLHLLLPLIHEHILHPHFVSPYSQHPPSSEAGTALPTPLLTLEHHSSPLNTTPHP